MPASIVDIATTAIVAIAMSGFPQVAGSAAPAANSSSQSTASPARIPFVVGLTTVRVVSTPAGDYETLRVIEAIDAAGFRIVTSGEVPGDFGDELVNVKVKRRVLAADQSSARRIRVYFHTDDDETFPGTVPGFSAAVVNELRHTGKTIITYLDVGAAFGVSEIQRELSGTLTRVPDAASSLPVLVNGRMTQLPIIRAKGVLSAAGDHENFEYTLLDDPANPLLLRSSGAGASSAVIRIEYPEPKASATSIENSLSRNEVAQVYGIYFSFNRADIRAESERTLKEIAGILVAHPDWKLRVDGHTDSVGNDVENLDLSKRRAAAVKQALVARYRVVESRLLTDGHGESSPQATNATPEGRARNRRVELRRQ